MLRIEEFLDHLAKSRLLRAEHLELAQQKARALAGKVKPDEATATLARELVQQRRLTGYQAKKLLSGATKGFFLGDYRILRPIGEGGMGKVFLAQRESDQARFAVKVLPPRKAVEGSQSLKRFLREMELSRRVVHPNVARTIDIGHVGNVYFMVLEYIPGASLYDLVRGENGGPLRVPDAARYFLKVLDGLEAAHAVGLVHRDIKPSNLMVTPEGDAKVLDLGLARSTEDETLAPLTAQHVVIGTLDYASPEQLGNAANADLRSDLYSLGCSLYFALAGKPPFDGGDVVNKIFKQRMDDPPPLERVARGVPAAFAAIVRKLMAKAPGDRYQSCKEVRADLLRWTDPSVVRAILGAEADSARAFRPPPPRLDEDDLRILDDEFSSGAPVSLRDLGEAEAPRAPMHKPPPPPRPAVMIMDDRRPGTRRTRPAPEADDVEPVDERPVPNEDLRFLIRFAAIAIAVGIILLLVLLLMRAS